MNEIMLFEQDWGNLVFSFSFCKLDVLPRITLSAVPRASIVNVGFIFFTLNLTIWDDKMREFNRRNRERAHPNEAYYDTQ